MSVICGAAVVLAFAEEVSVWVICGAAVVLAFAEEVSVWVIEEVSARGICGAEGYIGVCRGGACVSDLWRHNYFGVWQKCSVSVSHKQVYRSVKPVSVCEVRMLHKSHKSVAQ